MEHGLLTVTNLNKSFGGIHALHNVSLTIREHEIHCFAGINGSGKSTFIKCVSGIYAPDSGQIFLNGNQYETLSPTQAIAEGVQVIYQDLSLFSHLTVAENIAISHVMNKPGKSVSWNEIYSIARAQLEKIGVSMEIGRAHV